MTLILHGHPLSNFVQKVTMALFENKTPFELKLLDLADTQERTAFREMWPIGKMPVLHDTARKQTVPEASIIIEYLAQHYPGRVELVPKDPDLARQTRFRDRFFDLYVAMQMQKIVIDRLRPEGQRDPFGVEEARTTMKTALDMIDGEIGDEEWAMGAFSMADCSAAPALSYADRVMPFGKSHPNAHAYLQRLRKRASFVRVLEEAAPYEKNFPTK